MSYPLSDTARDVWERIDFLVAQLLGVPSSRRYLFALFNGARPEEFPSSLLVALQALSDEHWTLIEPMIPESCTDGVDLRRRALWTDVLSLTDSGSAIVSKIRWIFLPSLACASAYVLERDRAARLHDDKSIAPTGDPATTSPGGGQGGEASPQTTSPNEVAESGQVESRSGSRRSPRSDFRFDVALSYPGERRAYVENVATSLGHTLGKERVFYDRNFQGELARFDLDVYLQRLYHDESELIAVFLCEDYGQKEWCGLEWRALRDLIKQRKHKGIVPLRFDDTPIPGVFSTDGYIDLRCNTPEQTAQLILQRLQVDRAADGQ